MNVQEIVQKLSNSNKYIQRLSNPNKYILIGIVCVVLFFVYSCFNSPSLTQNEQVLCSILRMDKQYKENPKYAKCVLSKLADKFSDELDVIDSIKKGKKTDAALGGLNLYIQGDFKHKLISASTEIYSKCKKYK